MKPDGNYYCSGSIRSCRNYLLCAGGGVQQRKARGGAGEVLCVALGILVQYAEGYLNLGINLPVASAVCTYIVLMETGSAMENICAINPELSAKKLLSIIGIGKDDNK